MNYELAKKLKDSGFPKENSFDESVTFIDSNGTLRYGNELSPEYNPCLIPTLSELIEACEDNFLSLALFGKTWQAFRQKNIEPVHGSTPEEAVANLWMQLHPKKESEDQQPNK